MIRNQQIWVWLISLTSVLIFLVMLGSYVFEFRHLSNTFSAQRLVIHALFIGASTGLSAGYFFQRKYKEPLEKLRIMLLVLFLFCLITPLFGSLINRMPLFSVDRVEGYEYVTHKAYFSNRYGFIGVEQKPINGHYLFIIHNNHLQRLTLENALPSTLKRGDSIYLKMRKGILGYDWFTGEFLDNGYSN